MASNADLVAALVEKGVLTTTSMIEAVTAVDRGFFLPGEMKEDAYEDRPLRMQWPPGSDSFVHQSAPHMYARIIEILAVQPGQAVLNVGSGTGYLSTLLAWFAGPEGTSHGVEQYESNVVFAKKHAMEKLRECDMAAPLNFFVGNIFKLDTESSIRYDRIYVGANCKPDQVQFFYPLLADGGVLLIPSDGGMLKIVRTGGNLSTETVLGVRFAELAQPPADANPFCCLTQAQQAAQLLMKQEQLTIGHQITHSASMGEGAEDDTAAPSIFLQQLDLEPNLAESAGFVTPLCAFLKSHGMEKYNAM